MGAKYGRDASQKTIGVGSTHNIEITKYVDGWLAGWEGGWLAQSVIIVPLRGSILQTEFSA